MLPARVIAKKSRRNSDFNVKIIITAITIGQLIAALHSSPAATAGLGGMLALGPATGW
jgi:hypothetical protein